MVKNAARQLVEKHFVHLDDDYYTNRRYVRSVINQSKRMINKIAGRVTKLMKRVQTGEIRGLYIKEHEEEREKRENVIPKVSFLDSEKVVVDEITGKMIDELGLGIEYVTEKEELKIINK